MYTFIVGASDEKSCVVTLFIYPHHPIHLFFRRRYPKAGTPNPTTDLLVVEIQGSEHQSYVLRPPTIIRQK